MNLENKKFENWTALYPLKKNGHIYWHCRCSCGKERDVLQYSLTSGKSKSCGHDRTNNAHIKNLIGKKFGMLTVIEQTSKRISGSVVWKCKCDCGNIIEKSANALQSEKNPNCGCLNNLIGQHFGRLTVVSLAGKTINRQKLWNCLCECGNQTIVATSDLKSGKVYGCGCTKSIGEYNIAKCLKENNIPFQKEYSFSDLVGVNNGKLRYDFAILDNNNNPIRLVEFDGEQHFEKNNGFFKDEIVQHDIIKNNYAKEKNIPLIRLPYNLKNKITIELLLGEDYLI